MNRVEHRVAALAETDSGDNFPVAIELQDTSVLGVVVRAANAEVQSARGVGCCREDAARGNRVRLANPLPFEPSVVIE